MIARQVTLIKDSSVAHKDALGLQIIELPPFVLSRIANEDALSGMGFQIASLVFLHMDIGQAAKDAQVRHIRLVSMPELIGGVLLDSRGR